MSGFEESKGSDGPGMKGGQKLSKDTIQKAKNDLEKILGRKPTAAEVSKFIKGMPTSKHYNQANPLPTNNDGWE